MFVCHHLDNKAPPSEVVNQVASVSDSTALQFHRLLAEGDIDRY